MKNLAILQAIFLVLLLVNKLHGQSETEIVVSFPKGLNSTVIRGVVKFGGHQEYAVYAKKGQVIGAQLSSELTNVKTAISRPDYSLENLQLGTGSIFLVAETGKYIVHLSIATVIGDPKFSKKASDNKNYELKISLENPDIGIKSVYSGSTVYQNKYLGFEMIIPRDWDIKPSKELQNLIEGIQGSKQVVLSEANATKVTTIFTAERRSKNRSSWDATFLSIKVDEKPANVSLRKHFESVIEKDLSSEIWQLKRQISSVRIGDREFYKLTYTNSSVTSTYFIMVYGRKILYFALISSVRDEEAIENIMDGVTFFNQRGKVQTGREIKINRKKFVEKPLSSLQMLPDEPNKGAHIEQQF